MKLIKLWSNPIIEFYCREEFEGILPEPKPAVKFFPEWFKKIEPHIEHDPQHRNPVTGDKKSMTAKRCFPMIDAMSLGFVIPLQADAHIMSNHDNTVIRYMGYHGSFPIIESHSPEQIGGHNGIVKNTGTPLKFINYWIIKTAPGWSTLFIPQINHFDSPFTCLGGLVDTDTYPKEVNFPAVWHAKNFDSPIPAGTPLVTAIPIKREAFDKKPNIRKITKKEQNYVVTTQKIQNSRLNYYTNELRVKK
jgi:hypothetical protein